MHIFTALFCFYSDGGKPFSPRNCLRWHHKHRHGLRTQTTRNQLPGPLMTITPELTSNMVLDATALTHKIPTKQVSTFDVSARCDTHLNTQQTTFHHKIQTHSHYKSQPWCRHLTHLTFNNKDRIMLMLTLRYVNHHLFVLNWISLKSTNYRIWGDRDFTIEWIIWLFAFPECLVGDKHPRQVLQNFSASTIVIDEFHSISER